MRILASGGMERSPLAWRNSLCPIRAAGSARRRMPQSGPRAGGTGRFRARQLGRSGAREGSLPWAGVLRDALVMADDLGDDEVQQLLREGRVEVGVFGQPTESGDLLGL